MPPIMKYACPLSANSGRFAFVSVAVRKLPLMSAYGQLRRVLGADSLYERLKFRVVAQLVERDPEMELPKLPEAPSVSLLQIP